MISMEKKKNNNSVADDLFKTLLAPVSGPSAVVEKTDETTKGEKPEAEANTGLTKGQKAEESVQITQEPVIEAQVPPVQEQNTFSGSERANSAYGNYRPLNPNGVSQSQAAQAEPEPMPEAAMSYAAARRFRKKRPLRNCRTTISLTEEVREKADRAIDNGEIRSLNDLINYLLASYFNQNS
mgnify:CR=1 FL=1